MKANVSIAGGGGFTAGELLRLLAAHPSVRIASVVSSSRAGSPVAAAHDGLEDIGTLAFTDSVAADTDVLFLCLPHGESDAFLASQAVAEGCTVIDLSRDHRTDLTGRYVYGLPEAARDEILTAREKGVHVANPGCFATAIQLGLLPLLRAGILRGDVHTSAITGSTGAGRAALPTLHYSWRNDNVQVYDAFTHPHLDEMRATVGRFQPGYAGRHFLIPYRGPFTRGIIATSYTACDRSAAEIRALYRDGFADHPFVTVIAESPSLKQVVNTNRCIISVDVHDGMCVAVSVIDNLLKGAAGQAVQNMNLLLGLDERSGLRLKASAF
jgi:N-acetyl-gamma-glutamyl-phosphate reductase